MNDAIAPDHTTGRPAADPSLAFDATPDDCDVRMRAMSCRTCGIPFHVPAAWHAERVERGERVHCPNGHAIVAEVDFDDAHARSLGLLIELATSKLQLRAALRQLALANDAAASGPDPSHVGPGELERRVKLFATGLKSIGFGQKQCNLCGATFGHSHARNHLKTKHLAEIKAMPAAAFA